MSIEKSIQSESKEPIPLPAGGAVNGSNGPAGDGTYDGCPEQWTAGIPPMIQRAQAAFRRELPELMQTHYRQWVAYRGEERLGFAASKRELYQQCLSRGLTADEFLVESIEPPLPDRMDAEALRDW